MVEDKELDRKQQSCDVQDEVIEGKFLMLRYSKRKRSDEVRLEGCDQKKEETSVEEKALGMKKDLVWRVFLCFPIEAGCGRLSPARRERVWARPLHYL